ncbi:hypothetical protein B0I35DRAFT_473190 [Stachybotrys elegans]|uniref:TM7S3/TM198-like domain-containing protein n=1 Tax=Stachybotrys elegans TaxID=80388 RepID=A0A8K0T0Y0_9HYPO|nr:hypothetical protein B0I35DRAFT_473190 [Stachybotrys elegans]
MLPRASQLLAVLCALLVFQIVTAERVGVRRRQDDSEEPTSRPGLNTRTADEAPVSASAAESNGPDPTVSITRIPSFTTSELQPTVTSSAGTIDDTRLFNDTIPEGQLPLTPEITPGWGVAGVIMLITGIVYNIIGIKNRLIHTFFSTAYITSLGVTVLIIYVMSVPISNALQGGYVVAAVVSGCAAGVASMFFKELTEGLGCALGGFSMSMWFLCLVPGGLLQQVMAKAIFIASFTIVAFAFYFSRLTRDWALIVTIPFAGATVTVLGIDCFTRAGLKEFWAYIWDLNGNLFPLGADTYPVTRAIRVETAVVIIFFFVGVISQIKLWRVVREQKKKRAAERAEAQRNLEEEEANVGRQLEEQNARERRRWERAYGDGESSILSRVSYAAEHINEKNLRNSQSGSGRHSTTEVIEMEPVPEPMQPPPQPNMLMTADKENEIKVTVRVAADELPEGVTSDETEGNKVEEIATQDEKLSPAPNVPDTPDIVPLPFKVPNQDDVVSQSNRSSVATFSGDDDMNTVRSMSSPKRFSRGPASLLRKLSRGSSRTIRPRGHDNHEGLEPLVVPGHKNRDGDDGSIIATVDGDSSSDDGASSIGSPRQISAPSPVQGNDDGNEPLAEPETTEETENNRQKPGPTEPQSTDGAANTPAPADSVAPPSQMPVGIPKEAEKDAENEENLDAMGTKPESIGKLKSVASTISAPVNLTQETLPRSLSRVAMSYRTNEWAKHLSSADAPELDDLHIIQEPVQAEEAVPVDVHNLQKTAIDGAPSPAVKRSDSQISGVSIAYAARSTATRQNHRKSLDSDIHEGEDIDTAARQLWPPMAMPRNSAGFDPIEEESMTPAILPATTYNEATNPHASIFGPQISPRDSFSRSPMPGIVSYSSPQTLLGQREMFLKSKSQGNLLATFADHMTPHASPNDADSLYEYPSHPGPTVADVDDLPLRQRKDMMRRSTSMGFPPTTMNHYRNSVAESSENINFNSHQPKRAQNLPNQATREAQLANFRMSVANDLRASSPALPSASRETPFASTPNLLAPIRDLEAQRSIEVQRSIEAQRNLLIEQKEAEAQRREIQRREKEWADRAFEERMRSGDLLDAHREVMRKMQRKAT